MDKRKDIRFHFICNARWDCANIDKKGCRATETVACKHYKEREDDFLTKPKEKK